MDHEASPVLLKPTLLSPTASQKRNHFYYPCNILILLTHFNSVYFLTRWKSLEIKEPLRVESFCFTKSYSLSSEV